MCARTRRSTISLLTVIALGVAAALWGSVAPTDGAAAAPTTTVAAATTTTVAATTTTRPAPSTTAGVTTTTEAGPPPRSSQRVAVAVDAEKIRPTSLPLRTLGIATAVVIAALAIAGFVYGKVRSRVPVVATPRPVTEPPSGEPTGDATPMGSPITAPPPAPLPPPGADTLPPPEHVNEWAPPKT